MRLASLSRLVIAATIVSCRTTFAATLPTGFGLEPVITGPFSGQPVGFEFLPDGRIVTIELETGVVRLAATGSATSDSIYTIPDVTNDHPERGLLGVAADPDWPVRPYLYFAYTHVGSVTHVTMLTATGDVGVATSTAVTLGSPFLLLDDIPDEFGNHNGGTLRFGPDDMLYVSLGEDARLCFSQTLGVLPGGILRLDVSTMPGAGSGPPPKADITPPDNPFPGPDEEERLCYAWGLRNPFRFTIDPTTGDLYAGDVGEVLFEEVNVVPAATGGGENFGWPQLEGVADPGFGLGCGLGNSFTDPAYVYPHAGLTSIVAGPLYRPVASSTSLPAHYDGSLFITEFFHAWIRRLVDTGNGWATAPPAPGQPSVENWGEGFGSISDFQEGPDGALYFCRMSAGAGMSAGLYRIVRTLPTAVDEVQGAQLLEPRAVPNPAIGASGTTIRWWAVNGGPHRLTIREVSGRLVRRLSGRAGSRDHGAIRWDGRTSDGSVAAAGVYFYRLSDPGGASGEGRVLLIR